MALPKRKNPSKKINSPKTWLIAGLSIIIVVSLFLVLYSPTRIALFGKAETALEICNNNADEDGDNLIDCYDPDCWDVLFCKGKICDVSAYPTYTHYVVWSYKIPEEQTKKDATPKQPPEYFGCCAANECFYYDRCKSYDINWQGYNCGADHEWDKCSSEKRGTFSDSKHFYCDGTRWLPKETTEQTCGDGIDNDADDRIDCADSNCRTKTGPDGNSCCHYPTDCLSGATCIYPVCKETNCGDTIDNDGDTLVDCDDPACSPLSVCAAAPPPAPPVCSDPDGSDIYQKTTVTAGTTTQIDKCEGGSVREYWCTTTGTISSSLYSCPAGQVCSEGRCVCGGIDTDSDGLRDNCDTCLATAPGGLVSYWSFKESGGYPTYDSFGNNDGNISGLATRVPVGKIGPALSFDGVDDYVEVNSLATLGVSTTKLTVEAWINRASKDIVNADYFIGDWNTWAPGPPGSQKGFLMGFYIGQTAPLVHVANGITYTTITDPSVDLSLNEWHHLAFTFDAPKVSLYVDGVLKKTVDTGYSQIVFESATPLYIGKSNINSGWFTGKIDEVSIFNTALDAKTISEHYYKGSLTTPKYLCDATCGTGKFVWSYILPHEELKKSQNQVPGIYGCCSLPDGCLKYEPLSCVPKSTSYVSDWLCGKDNNHLYCGSTESQGYYVTNSWEVSRTIAPDNRFYCDGTKWLKVCTEATAATICAAGESCVDVADVKVCKTTVPTVILGDADNNRCLSIIEYNDFKYNYKTDPSLAEIAEYNDWKYNYKTNQGNIVCPAE